MYQETERDLGRNFLDFWQFFLPTFNFGIPVCNCPAFYEHNLDVPKLLNFVQIYLVVFSRVGLDTLGRLYI